MAGRLARMFRDMPHKKMNEINAEADQDGKPHNHVPREPLGSKEHPEKVMAKG